jgi:hypothetical protein
MAMRLMRTCRMVYVLRLIPRIMVNPSLSWNRNAISRY